MIQLRKIYERCKSATMCEGEDWHNPTGDEIVMSYLVKRLVGQVHRLNELGNHDLDLCPLCAGYTWGRPNGEDGMDFTRRSCSDCSEIRPEPEGEK